MCKGRNLKRIKGIMLYILLKLKIVILYLEIYQLFKFRF